MPEKAAPPTELSPSSACGAWGTFCGREENPAFAPSLSHRTTILGKLWNVTLNIRRIFNKEAKRPTLKELKLLLDSKKSTMALFTLLINLDCPHCHYASDGIVCSHMWLEFQLSCGFVLLRVSGCNSISDFCLLAQQRLCKLHAGADRCKTDRNLLFSGGLKPGFRQLRNSSKLSFQSAFSSESSIRASTQRLLWDTCRDHLYSPFRTTHFIQMWSQGSKIQDLFVFSIHYLANRICSSAVKCLLGFISVCRWSFSPSGSSWQTDGHKLT